MNGKTEGSYSRRKRTNNYGLLEKEGISSGDIRFMEGKSLDLTEFGLKAEKDRISGSTPDVLYKAAKAYIGYIQEIGK